MSDSLANGQRAALRVTNAALPHARAHVCNMYAIDNSCTWSGACSHRTASSCACGRSCARLPAQRACTRSFVPSAYAVRSGLSWLRSRAQEGSFLARLVMGLCARREVPKTASAELCTRLVIMDARLSRACVRVRPARWQSPEHTAVAVTLQTCGGGSGGPCKRESSGRLRHVACPHVLRGAQHTAGLEPLLA